MLFSTKVEVVHEVPGFGPCVFTMRPRTQADVIRWSFEMQALGEIEQAADAVSEAQATIEAINGGEASPDVLAKARASFARLREVTVRNIDVSEKIAANLGPLILHVARQEDGEPIVFEDEDLTWEVAMQCSPLGVLWISEFFNAYLQAVGARRGKSETK